MKKHPISFTILGFLLGYIIMFQITRDTAWTVDLKVETGGILKWYVDTGAGFSEREGNYGPVPRGVDQTVRLVLPSGSPRAVRLDPVDSESRIILKRVEWREPWPGGTGFLDPGEAVWENVSLNEWDEAGFLILEPTPGVSDVFGVWREVPTHSLFWWRAVRLSGALVLGVIAFALGTFWNHQVLKRAATCESDRDALAPYLR